MINVTMQKAGNGDCISIETNTEFVLIDGGTSQSFTDWRGNVTAREKVDALIVSHIDNDHVNGIIQLLQHEECPSIDQFYFNGAEQLFGALDVTEDTDRATDTKLRAISEEYSITANREQIGYSEGTSLSYLLSRKGIACNSNIHGGALYREQCESFDVGSLKFYLIGPDLSALQYLKDHWEEGLTERRIKPRIISKAYYEAFELYANSLQENTSTAIPIASSHHNSIEALAKCEFEDDRSLANRSSLSFLIESNSKKLLYLSDCHAGIVLSWLDEKRLEKIEVDAVKVSHHGSKNNISLDLLKRIVCKKYLISTNGKVHKHPDLEALARIAFVNKDSGAEIFLNYKLDHIPEWFMSELERKYPSIVLSMDSCKVEL